MSGQKPFAAISVLAAALCTFSGPAWAQPATQPATQGPAETQPSIDVMQARVVKVEGRVNYSLLQPDGSFGPRQPVKVDDLLPPGTRIETSLRSHVVFMFGDDTVVMIDRATRASIDQFRRVGDTKEIRLGLGHGAVRAGVAETTLRSDMTISTPTATLSKRGTQEFGIEYEPSTGRFRVFLTDQGLVEVLNRLTGISRALQPGEYVTQAMVRWIEMAKFDRFIPVMDAFGLTNPEHHFNVYHNTGPGISQPGGGALSNVLAGRPGTGLSTTEITGRLGTTPPILPLAPLGSPLISRPEGNFGARR